MLASKRPALGESVCLLVILSLCVSNAIKTRGAELAVGQPNKTADLTKLISETLAINNKTSPSTGASRDDWTFDRVEYDLMEFLQDLSARYKQRKPSEAQDQELLDARREWTETVNEIKQALNITGDDLGPKKSSNEKPAQSSTPSPTNSDTTTATPAAKITAATPPALGTSLASGDHDLSESSWQYGIFDRFTRPRSTSTLAPPDVNMDRVNVRDFNSDECGLRTYEVEQNTFYPQSPITAAEAIKELNQRRQRPVQIPLAGQKKYQFDSAADFGITDYDKRLFNEEASKINDERQSSSIDDNTNWDSEFNLSSRRQWLQQQLGHTLQLLGFNGTTSSMSEFLNQTSGESMNTRENMMKMSGKLGKSLPTGSQAPVDATASVDQLKARQDELKLEARVIGGTDARLGDSPWSVSLQALVSRPGTGAVEYRHYCGGSIISEYYILTAAHCLDFMVGRESRLFVVVGDLNWRMSAASMYGRRFGIDKLIIHSGYKSTAFGHDIGLIRTKESMKPLKVNGRYIVNSVCLPEKGVEHTGEAELVGWGLFSNRNEMADSLQIADVPILPRPLCVDLYRRRTGLIQWLIGIELITDKQVCAGTFGRGICQGDSGSALVFNEKVPRVGVMRKTRQISKILRNHLAEREQQSRATIIGIVAFGGIRRCSYQSLPGVYMQTSKYMDWILPRIHA